MRILKNENHIKHLNLFLRKNSVKNIDKKEYSELSYCEEEPVCYNCLSSFPCLLLLKFLGFSVVFFCFGFLVCVNFTCTGFTFQSYQMKYCSECGDVEF